MNKVIFAMLLLMATGCAGVFRAATDVANRAYIGMPVREFQRLTGKSAQLESMTADYTVYRMDVYSYNGQHHAVYGAKFFHFDTDGKLFKIDSVDFREIPGWGGYGHGSHQGQEKP